MACKYTLKINSTGKVLTFNSEKELDNYLLSNYTEFEGMVDHTFRFSKDYITMLDTEQVKSQDKLDKDRKLAYEKAKARNAKNDDTIVVKGQGEMTDVIENEETYSDGFISVLKFLSRQRGTSAPLINAFSREGYKRNTRIGRSQGKPEDVSPEEWLKQVDSSIDQDFEYWDYLQEIGRGFHLVMDTVINSNFDISADMVDSVISKKFERDFLGGKNLSTLNGVSTGALMSFIKGITALKKNIILNSGRGRKFKKFYTEYVVDHDGGPDAKLRGKIDLLAVFEDNEGNQSVEIYDLKLATKPQDRWDADKKNTIQYQLGFYKRMLQAKGIAARNISTKIIPVLIEGDKILHKIDKVSVGEPEVYLPNIGQKANIDEIIKIPIGTENLSNPLENTVSERMSKFFPMSKINPTDIVDFDMLFASQVHIDKNTGEYWFRDVTKSTNEKGEIRRATKEEAEAAFEDYLVRKLEHDNDVTLAITNNLKYSLDKVNGFGGKNFNPTRTGLQIVPANTYEPKLGLFEANLSKYKNEPGWNIISNDALTNMNVILLINETRKEMDLISIASHDLNSTINLGKGNNIFGRFKSDREVELDKQVIKATVGNVELMKLLSIANAFQETDLGSYTIGEMKVVNIGKSEYLSSYLNQEKINHAFNTLCELSGQSKGNTLRFTDEFDIAWRTFNNIMNYGSYENRDRLDKIAKSLSIDGEITSFDKQAKMDILTRMFKELQARYFSTNASADISNPIAYLFLQVSNALAKYGNTTIDIYNEELWAKNFGNLVEQWKRGELFNGTYLNTIDTIPIVKSVAHRLAETNRNITNLYGNYKNKDRAVTNKFYQESGQGFVGKTIINDSTIRFKRLLDQSDSGKRKFMVKNPYDMSTDLNPAERSYLKYWLEDLNNRRYPGQDRAEVGERYFEIPLLRGSSFSKITNGKNPLVTYKEDGSLEMVNPRMTTTAQEEYLSTDALKNLVEMYNVFDISNSVGGRERLLSDTNGKPEQTYETNLEHIKDMYVFSDIRKKEMDTVLPAINAAIISLQFTQRLSNKDAQATIDFLNDYIKSAVFDESLIDKESRGTFRTLGMLRSVSTKFILGFNYLSGAKETITGFFNLYERAVANSLLDKDKIGLKDMTSAYTTVWVDSVRQISTITILEHLNWQYRMANVDMNALVDRMNYEKTDGFRFTDRMFWANRAPDFLSRMTILIGYMKKHGCYDAHEYKNGEVTYNWKKDKRFSLLANPNADTNSSEWQYQRSLYNAMMETFFEENYKLPNADGTSRFLSREKDSRGVYKEALPQAYTTLEANMIKQESDGIFGYMDHDTKSLYLKKGVFIFLHQFQTFLSAKKNQYFLKRGTYDQGHWVQVTDDAGNKLYWDTVQDNEGNTIKVKTTENTGDPIVDWQGKIMEGIAWSLRDLFNFTKPERMKDAWRDPVKRRNLLLALEDGAIIGIIYLMLALLFGDKDAKAMTNTEQAVARIARNVGGEFNMFAIFNGAVDFKMPMHQFYSDLFKDGVKVASGNMHVLRFFTDNTGAFRPLKPTVIDNFKAPNADE